MPFLTLFVVGRVPILKLEDLACASGKRPRDMSKKHGVYINTGIPQVSMWFLVHLPALSILLEGSWSQTCYLG